MGRVQGGCLTLQGNLAVFTKALRTVLAYWKRGDDWGISIDYEMGGSVTEDAYQDLLLGFCAWKSAFGLILVPAKDGTFLRIRQFRIPPKEKEYSWAENHEIWQITIV